MTSSPPTRPHRSVLRTLGTIIACLGILGGAAAAVVVINRTEPTATKSKETRKSAAIVDTIIADRGMYSPRLIVLGSVQPAQDVMLSPRVSGQVTEVAERFIPGGRVAAGELLLRIDPSDFQNVLDERLSQLEQATASLKIEEGRQIMARKELSLLEGSIATSNRSLVLREPQIASVKAEVDAAEAAVTRARLDVERTEIIAPFDAQILTREVNIGSQVSPGDTLARVVGTAEYWVAASVPVRNLRWIRFPHGDEPGSSVTIRNRDSWGEEASRSGEVIRLIGALDERTRLARVLVSVRDPLAENITSDSADKSAKREQTPPLILDSLVELEIEGRPIEDVVRLSREHVRDGDTVWILDEGALAIRSAEIVFQDASHAYVRSGVEDGDEVVISTLATVAEGIGLKRREQQAEVVSESVSNTGEGTGGQVVASRSASDKANEVVRDQAVAPAENDESVGDDKSEASQTESSNSKDKVADEPTPIDQDRSARSERAEHPLFRTGCELCVQSVGSSGIVDRPGATRQRILTSSVERHQREVAG